MSHPSNNSNSNPNSYQRYNNNRGPPQGQDSGPYSRGNAHQQGNNNGREYNHPSNSRDSYRSRDYTPREYNGRDYNSSYNNRRDYSNSGSANNRGDYDQGYDRRDSRPQYQSRDRFYDQRGGSSGGQLQQQHMEYGYPERGGGSYGGYNQGPHPGGYGMPYGQPGGQPRGFDRRRMENNRGDERSQQYYSSDRNSSNNGGYFEGYNNNSRQVMGFYNQKRDFGRDQRSNLETLPIRIFHNWVKSVLIQKYGEKQRELVKKEVGISSYLPENYLYVLDVACGKGGDHKKWLMHSHTAFYVGVDIAFESLNEAHKRAIKTLEEIKMNSRYHSNIKFGFFGKDATCSREDFWKYIIRTPEEEAADPYKKLKGADNSFDVDAKDKGDDGNGSSTLGTDKNYTNEEGEECKQTGQDPKENIEQNKGEQREQDGSQYGQDKAAGEVDLEDPIYNDQDGEVKQSENSSSEQQNKPNQSSNSSNSTGQTSKNGSITATNTSSMANPDQSTYMFDLASCQMSLHYMLETEASARNFLDNCTYKLNEKGYLLLTFTDASKIIELMKTHGKAVSAAEEDGPHVYKAKHFSLKFDVSGEQIEKKFKTSPYGVKYDFYLQEAVGQEVDGQIQYVPEYLVDTPKLIELAKEFGLEVKENSNFVDFYQSNKLEFADLLRQMKVPFSTEEDTKDPDTWTISHCYRVLVFQKLNRGPRVKFDRSTRDKFLYKYPVPFNFFPKKRPQI